MHAAIIAIDAALAYFALSLVSAGLWIGFIEVGRRTRSDSGAVRG
jgi:hypothetical protein